MSLDLAAIRAAHAAIRDKIHRTPVLTSQRLDEACGARLFFKCENFQKGGAFKARGATHAVFSLADSAAARGVATHSSGNHAAAVARAARLRGIAAHVVMPDNSSPVKLEAVRGYGVNVILCAPTLQAREEACARVLAETGAAFVHPYNDLRVMAGQGTAALELLEDVPGLDLVLVPVGGGGLLSGTAVAVKELQPGTRVVAAEPEQADDARRSFLGGRIVPAQSNTIADGLRSSLGELNFPIIRARVDDIVTVSEAAIVAAMRRIWTTMKIIVEPSGAVPYAAIAENKIPVAGLRVGLILSGGNVDLDSLPWLKS
jgi:threonine dehydratase